MTNENKNPAFSLRRCALLVRNRLYDEASSLGVGAAVIVGLNLLGLILSKRAWLNQTGGTQLWSFAVVLGGLLLAAQAFKGMHAGKAGSEWLLLPASPLEKYAAAAADYLLIYPLAAAAAASLASLLLSLLERALGGTGGTIWTPLALGGFRGWGEYAIAAALLMAGSASFRKAPLVKTAGIATVYVLAMSLLAFVGVLIFFNHNGEANYSVLRVEGMALNFGGKTLSEGAIKAETLLLDIARYGLAPLFALSYGYFRVFEKEARDEVQ
jgi:hypothetical protein